MRLRQAARPVQASATVRRTLRQAETEGGFVQLPILEHEPSELVDGYVWLERFGSSLQLKVAIDGVIKLLGATP
jgi:hypothetical protein